MFFIFNWRPEDRFSISDWWHVFVLFCPLLFLFLFLFFFFWTDDASDWRNVGLTECFWNSEWRTVFQIRSDEPFGLTNFQTALTNYFWYSVEVIFTFGLTWRFHFRTDNISTEKMYLIFSLKTFWTNEFRTDKVYPFTQCMMDRQAWYILCSSPSIYGYKIMPWFTRLYQGRFSNTPSFKRLSLVPWIREDAAVTSCRDSLHNYGRHVFLYEFEKQMSGNWPTKLIR